MQCLVPLNSSVGRSEMGGCNSTTEKGKKGRLTFFSLDLLQAQGDVTDVGINENGHLQEITTIN